MTDTKNILINGESFPVSQPYVEGHVLTAAEARQLNQTRAEGVSNNTRKRVKELLEAGNAADAAAHVAEYDAKYNFSMPGVRAERKVVDPVEREALKLAREHVRAVLAKKGLKLTSIHPDYADLPEEEGKAASAERFETAIATVAANEKILKLARDNVKKKQATSDSLTDELGI